MTPIVQTITTILSFGSILIQIYIVVLVVGLIMLPKRVLAIVRLSAEHVFIIGLVVSSLALLLSLFYSQIAGFEPCTLCWWQRIFIYPQVIIFAVALYHKTVRGHFDLVATTTSLFLSIIGGLIALYQYYAQMFNPDLISTCAVTGVSCSKLFFLSFGFITIPFMSLVSFILLVVLVLTHKIYMKRISHA